MMPLCIHPDMIDVKQAHSDLTTDITQTTPEHKFTGKKQLFNGRSAHYPFGFCSVILHY